MVEEFLEVFDAVDLVVPAIPTRSRLFHLEPIGVGTPNVESLTGYIHRLAEAHCVRPSTLFNMIVSPALQKWLTIGDPAATPKLSDHPTAINGIGATAVSAAAALENLTSCKDLHLLTMLPWRNVTVNHHLIRPNRAWCPECYQRWRDQGVTLFEPLVWSLDPVRVCAEHGGSLAFACPNCRKRSSVLSGKARPGYCPACDGWLGEIRTGSGARNVLVRDGGETAEQEIARHVGELVAGARPLATLPMVGAVANSLRRCAEEVSRGKAATFSKMLGCSNRNMGGWVAGSSVPRLGSLMRLIRRIGIPVHDFLAGNVAGAGRAFGALPVRAECKPCARKSDWAGELKALKAAQVENPPPSLYEVAARINPGQEPRRFANRLRSHLPEECRVIFSRCAEHQRLQRTNRLRDMLREALNENPPLSMNEVSNRIAKRLGWRRCTVLYRMFPDLCYEIAARYKAYKKRGAEESMGRLREDIRRAVRTLHSQNIYPGRHQVRAFLGLRPDLTNAGRVFHREAKAELGIT